ncbi:hypothetical protein D3C73_1330740 [compost metagenome]
MLRHNTHSPLTLHVSTQQRQRTGQRIQQRALPQTVTPEHGPDIAFLTAERERRKQRHPVAILQLIDVKCGRYHRFPRRLD